MNSKRKRLLQKMNEENDSVNSDLHEVVIGYYKYSSKSEIIFDWGIPILVSLILFTIVYALNSSGSFVLLLFSDMNTVALSVMAILAGFNTTSLAVIASTNSKTLKKLLDAKIENKQSKADSKDNEISILKQIISFFSYAVVFQITILIIGAIFVILNKNVPVIYKTVGFISASEAIMLASIIGFLWFSIILHNLFVSLRNATLLYRYIMYVAKQHDEEL